MNRACISRIATPVLVAAILVAGPAIAQPAPPASSQQTAGPAAPRAVGALSRSMSASIEQHISQLHDQLQITPAQQPQWQQFAEVMRDNAAKMNRVVAKRSARSGAMSADQSMQSYAQLAQVHATNMQKLASSFAALYAGFPDSQKQVADAVFRESNGRVVPHTH